MPGAKALPTRKLVALRLELPADMPGAQALPTQRSVAPKLALSADVPGARALPTRRPGFCSGPDSAATLLGRGLALPFCPLGLVRVARQARRDRRFARVLPGQPDKGPVGRLFGPGAGDGLWQRCDLTRSRAVLATRAGLQYGASTGPPPPPDILAGELTLA